MPESARFLAFDLGASSGRAVVGGFDGRRIELTETHRFENNPVPLGDALYWNIFGLYDEILQGLRASARGGALDAVGIDTWGVDFGLLDANDELVGSPHCYRDPRVNGMMDAAFATVSREEIFDRTGIQFMELNTLYQLLAMVRAGSPQLDIARTFLTLPDLFNFWLTGVKAGEFSIATTTQFFNPRTNGWATDLLDALGIPTHFLPDIVQPGTRLGALVGALADSTGAGPIDVIAPACHDTGSAVAAVPSDSPDALYISCGTWALMGAEITEPAINAKALAHNFTNEGGVAGTYRFLKNIAGLWLVQECRHTWQRAGNERSFDELTKRARASDPLVTFVDPDHPDFVAPGDMPSRIRAFCKRTGQPVPESEGAVIRCALESLALKARHVHGQLVDVLGKTFDTIHLVGGGIQNTLLCQLIADATGCRVLAGPTEATALGNIIVQAIAKGRIGSLAEGREVVRNSTDIVTYEPTDRPAWDDAYARFRALL